MKEIECPNCGAVFAAGEAKCPYCGHINPMGAEAKFLRDLEKTRKDLDNVDEEAKEDYKTEIKRGAKSTVKTIVIVFIVLGLLIGGFVLMEKIMLGDYDKKDYAEELAWQHTAFVEYDQLFEDKKYEELMEKIYLDGEAGHDVWDWDKYEEFSEIADELWGDDQ